MDWEKDIAFIKKELPLLHKDFHKLVPPDRFASAMDRILDKYPEGNNHQVALEIQKVLAGLGVSHTGIPFYQAQVYERIPLYLEYFEDGLYITSMVLDEKEWTGCRVSGIGGHPLSTVQDTLRKLISHENEHWLSQMMPKVMRIPAVMYYLGLTDHPDSILFNLEGREDLHTGIEPKWLKMSGKTGLAAPWLKYQMKAYWFEAREDGILRIVYNSCREDQNYPFGEFCTDVRKALNSGNSKQVLVDLRWNEGGNSGVFKPMVKLLKESPDIPFYTAISKRTYSSGLFAARDLKRELGAPLLGQPTGGAPTGYGDVRRFQAPSSGMPVNYCIKYFSWPDFPGKTMEPDIHIAYTSEDFFSGHDPVIEYLINEYKAGTADCDRDPRRE